MSSEYRVAKKKRPRPAMPTRQVTTLWDFPSQDYGGRQQGVKGYAGATPSYVVWNLVQKYTAAKDLVIDPFCGSGTTLDVARDLDRRGLGYDVHPIRKDIFNRDARNLPAELTGKAALVFADPPYSTHLDYGDDPRDIGKLPAADGSYYGAMHDAVGEMARVAAPGGHVAIYVSDSYQHNKTGGTFHALGFELWAMLRAAELEPVDWVAVVRRNKTLAQGNYRQAADEGNYHLRGFNHLLIFRKPAPESPVPSRRAPRRQR